MNARRPFSLFLSTITASATLACGDGKYDAPTGQLTVSWQIGVQTCGSSGVSTIEITLSSREGIIDSRSQACQAGDALFPNVPEGEYRVDFAGYPAEGAFPTYQGTQQPVVVRAGFPNEAPRTNLSQTPGGLDLVWTFEDGSFCNHNDIDFVGVAVYDAASAIVLEREVSCDDPNPTPLPQAQAAGIPDPTPAQQYNPRGFLVENLLAGTYGVSLRAYGAASSSATFWSRADKIVVTHGQPKVVNLKLLSCAENESALFCGQ